MLRKFIMVTLGCVLVLVLGFAALLGWVLWQKRQYAKLADTRDLKARVQALGAGYVKKRGNAALVIGLIQEGKTHVLGFGRTGSNNSSPPDAQTVFEIGSITKVFTAAALARMHLQGAASLDDSLAECLPGSVSLPEEVRRITLKQLATHSSGLPRLPSNLDASNGGIVNPYAKYGTNELYAWLATAKLESRPGRKMAYSNLGAGLLGHALALRAGKPYEQLVRDLIGEPLSLRDTVFVLTEEQRQRLTPGHNTKGEVVPNWSFDVLAPAGALRSTARDMLEFLQASLSGETNELGRALRLAQETQFESALEKCGLGWIILDRAEGFRIHWHNGGTHGYASFTGFIREHDVGVVVLSNYGDAFANDFSVDRIGIEILKLATKVSWE